MAGHFWISDCPFFLRTKFQLCYFWMNQLSKTEEKKLILEIFVNLWSDRKLKDDIFVQWMIPTWRLSGMSSRDSSSPMPGGGGSNPQPQVVQGLESAAAAGPAPPPQQVGSSPTGVDEANTGAPAGNDRDQVRIIGIPRGNLPRTGESRTWRNSK